MAPLLTVENQAGSPITSGKNTLVPINQAWHLKLPLVQDGLIWNRPVSVVVQEAGQQEIIVPVQDITRQVLWLLFGLSLTSLLLGWLAGPRPRRSHSTEDQSEE